MNPYITNAKTVACDVCGHNATHITLPKRDDEQDLLLTGEEALCPSCVKVVKAAAPEIKMMTRAALYRRWAQMDERYTRAWKNLRGVLASTRSSYAQERQAEDRYADACHKFDLVVVRCNKLGMDVPGLVRNSPYASNCI